MKIAALAAVALLAGCAASVPLHVKVKQVSDVQICEGVFFGPPHVAEAARGEASIRGLNCANYHALVIQQRQAQAIQQANQAAAMQNLSRQLMTPAPTIQAPRHINCTSRRIGTAVYTDCN